MATLTPAVVVRDDLKPYMERVEEWVAGRPSLMNLMRELEAIESRSRATRPSVITP